MRSKYILFSFCCLTLLMTRFTDAKIVFTSNTEVPLDIYVMDDDGNNLRKLTNTAYDEARPNWSPDGRSIAFARIMTPLGAWPQIVNIFLMDADGQGERQLTDWQGGDFYPIFTPDGEHLTFSRSPQGGESTLAAIHLASGDLGIYVDAHVDTPDWSPDGKTIVYGQGRDIYTMTAAGKNAKLLLRPLAVDIIGHRTNPKWSPDGRSVLYIEDVYSPELLPVSNGVFIYHLSSRTQERLSIPKAWRVHSVDWMGDKNTIVLSADEVGIKTQKRGNYNIYRYHLPSKTVTQLTHLPGASFSVDWVEGPLEVSPKKKKVVRWGAIKNKR